MRIIHLCLAQGSNAGDIALKQAAQKELIKNFPEAQIKCIDITRVDWNVASVDYLNQNADLIVLGPGGVFLKPLKSKAQWLWDISPELLEKIKVPIFDYSIGFNAFPGQEDFDDEFKKSLDILMDKSIVFSLRHKGGIKSLEKYLSEEDKDKVLFNFCPTLVYPEVKQKGEFLDNKKRVAILCAGDRLRYRHKKMRDFGNQINLLKTKLQNSGYKVSLVLHRKGDEWIERYCGDFDEIVDLASQPIDKVCETYSAFDYVIGDRGHCQMIAYACGARVIVPVSHSKLKWFFEDIDLEEYLLAEDDEQLANNIFHLMQSIDDEKWYDHYLEQMHRFRALSNDLFLELKERLSDA